MDQVDKVIDALSARLRELESEAAGTGTSSPAAGDSHDVSSEPQE
jgi:hypothetical protein